MLTLFTDTDTDFSPKLAKEYGFKIISMPYYIDGKEYMPYDENGDFDAHKFYDLLRQGVLPTTSALPPQAYIEYFEPEFKKGNDIFYVHFSGAMSGTFNSMRLALEDLKEKYPDRKFYEVDTKGITAGSYEIVLEIAKMFKSGKTVEEVLTWAETEVDKFATYFYADNLKFFAKSGRVSNFAAIMGGIIGIKPIIHMNSEGKMMSIDKGRGRVQTLKKIVEYVKKLQDNIFDHEVLIAHTDNIEIAHQLEEMLQKEFGGKLNIVIRDVNPTAGSHCGPDCVGVNFHAIHR
ncbi:MAG: DegV family protein [Bacilli bacterium]|nr:DegV family protein [Bacilli bacterium]